MTVRETYAPYALRSTRTCAPSPRRLRVSSRLSCQLTVRCCVEKRVDRARIAHGMHDVIGHSVSVMVVQAGGIHQVVRTDPAAAEGVRGWRTLR